MTALPRILTVDSTGAIARLVRAVLELAGQTAIQTDVPAADVALAEVGKAGYTLLVTAFRLDAQIDGAALASRVHNLHKALPVLIIAAHDDPETTLDEPTLCLRQPLDPHQMIRSFMSVLQGGDLHVEAPAPAANAAVVDPSTIPLLDLTAVSKILETLERDISPLTLFLATRAGEVLIQRGSEPRLDRAHITQALLPAMQSTLQMGGLVGGKISTLQFFDGDTYDIFVLAAGYHHFLCLVFDGKTGSNQIGSVRRYAQRAANDVVALLGAHAFTLPGGMNPAKKRTRSAPTPTMSAPALPAVEPPVLPPNFPPSKVSTAESERVVLPPIENFDPSRLFEQKIDNADADALFDLDNLAEIARSSGTGSLLSDDDARRLGIVQ